ncbi:MAG: hypothetical protein PHV49_00110 [Alistipes sp.]|nr:hypothetical protein [Alistipes sp.]
MPINSILYPFRELLHLFFPERCPACGGVLPEGVRFLCPHCQWDMPLTGYSIRHDNPVARKFWGQIPVEEATSLLFFSSHSRYRTLIHGFKYYGQWRSALQLGEMLGRDLHQSGRYDTVDRVIPIPLHRRRLWYRGYNQSEYLAQGVARILAVPV